MPKINEENYLSLVIENLTMLKDAFADGVIPLRGESLWKITRGA